MKISQADQFELPPRRGELVQWHLTAETPEPTSQLDFVTVLQPYRAAEGPPAKLQVIFDLEATYRLSHLLVLFINQLPGQNVASTRVTAMRWEWASPSSPCRGLTRL